VFVLDWFPLSQHTTILRTLKQMMKVAWMVAQPEHSRKVHHTVMLSTFVYGLPTSSPGQGQHIVARHRCMGPPPEAEKRLSVGYDVLTLRG